MQKTKPRSTSHRRFIEALEDRRLLSVATMTTLTAPSATLLGQPIVVAVTVQDAGGAAVSGGSVTLLNSGTPTGLAASVDSAGVATFTFGAGNALYAGNYSLSASYSGTSNDLPSDSNAAGLTVSLPTFTTTGDGLQVATVVTGTGAGAVTGQSITAEYSGFYETDGSEFDESSAHSPPTFGFTLNANPEQVITGFDEGTAGIAVGETRVLVIPSALGYMDGMTRVFVIQSEDPNATSGPATQLSISSAPLTATAGQPITTPFNVTVNDANGNIVTSDGSLVVVSIASGPAGAVLGGSPALTTQKGLSSFTDFTFPEAGTYTLVATDSDSTLTVTSAPITVTGGSSSSIGSALGNVKLPAAVVAGGKLAAKIPVVISNEGSNIKGNVTVNIYADTSNTLDGNQVLVTSQSHNLSIKANKSHVINLNIKSLPATLPDGSYYLLAEVSAPSGATSVTSTAQTVAVAAAFVQPMATVGAVVPATIVAGKSGSVLITIANEGNVPSTALSITLAPSSDGTTPIAGTVLYSLSKKMKILPGKTKSFRAHFKVPAGAAPGSYFPFVTATLSDVSTTAAGTTAFSVS